MGCAASTSAQVPYVVSKRDGSQRPIRLGEGGQLDLTELDLTELPESILPLGPQLLDLSLENNALDVSAPSFASTLQALVVLRRISLEGNRLLLIPDVLFERPLEQLPLRNNAIKELPTAVRGLAPTLVELNLDKNFLTCLPDEVGELRSLRLLSAGHNMLPSLPEGIRGLRSLSTLWLEHNRLRSLGEAVCELSRLEDLNLHDNRLSVLPDNLQSLRRLKWLALGKNRFDALPASLFGMASLETLHVQNNSLKALPDAPTCDADEAAELTRPPVSAAYSLRASGHKGTTTPGPLHRQRTDPLGQAIDGLRTSQFNAPYEPDDDAMVGSAAVPPSLYDLGDPPARCAQQERRQSVDSVPSTESGPSQDSSSTPSATPSVARAPQKAQVVCSGLRVVWLSGNPLCAQGAPPPTLLQLPRLEECRMKLTNDGKPLRSSSFDLGNWKGAVDVAAQIDAVNANRNRRGSFKKEHGESLEGITPPPARRKVSFTGQLPTSNSPGGSPFLGRPSPAGSPSEGSPAGKRSPFGTSP